ncbi:MAG TPA: carboxypeptidase-like regulatory domain-containing protein [Planctomycetaceae bacterium]|nr:carboxypeptidase-like regulatory domain-containing protein [Planctomycetaceae bacterium]
MSGHSERGPHWAAIAIGLSSVVFASSCGRSKTPEIQGKLPVFPVKGTLILEGKPLANADLVFHPTTPLPKDASQILPRGRTNEDGAFNLTTYYDNDGAPAGKYRVTVSYRGSHQNLRTSDEPELMPSAYRSPRESVLRAEVQEGDNDLPPLEIKLTPEQQQVVSEASSES